MYKFVKRVNEEGFPPAFVTFEFKARTLSESIDQLNSYIGQRFEGEPSPGTGYDAYRAAAVASALDPNNDGAKDWLIDHFPKDPEGFPDYRRRSDMANACIFAIRAEQAMERGEHDLAWYLVSEAMFYSGMAEGHYAATQDSNRKHQRASKGGRATAAKRDPVKEECVRLLVERRPAAGWKTKQDAIQQVARDLGQFIDEGDFDMDSDVHRRLRDWLSQEEAIVAAYEGRGR
jgi:hypothetical protein